MLIVHIEPASVWDYYRNHVHELNDMMHKIAEDSDSDIAAYISDADGQPEIIVMDGGEVAYSDIAIDKDDCTIMVAEVYNDRMIPEEPVEHFSEEEEIEIREDELNTAVNDFLLCVLDGFINEDADDFKEMREDIKDHFIEYIARKHGFKIYRPRYLEFEDGDRYVDYPYECMEFEDEDNPIYKKS